MAVLQYIGTRGPQLGAFFLDTGGKPVAKTWFVEQNRAILDSIGALSHQYAGHSFRIGAATMAGVEDSTLGQWHSIHGLHAVRHDQDP